MVNYHWKWIWCFCPTKIALQSALQVSFDITRLYEDYFIWIVYICIFCKARRNTFLRSLLTLLSVFVCLFYYCFFIFSPPSLSLDIAVCLCLPPLLLFLYFFTPFTFLCFLNCLGTPLSPPSPVSHQLRRTTDTHERKVPCCRRLSCFSRWRTVS